MKNLITLLTLVGLVVCLVLYYLIRVIACSLVIVGIVVAEFIMTVMAHFGIRGI